MLRKLLVVALLLVTIPLQAQTNTKPFILAMRIMNFVTVDALRLSLYGRSAVNGQ